MSHLIKCIISSHPRGPKPHISIGQNFIKSRCLRRTLACVGDEIMFECFPGRTHINRIIVIAFTNNTRGV